MNTNINDMRIYDFNVLKQSMSNTDISNISSYEIPTSKLPNVKDQKDYCCCVACVLAEVLEFFNQIETNEFKEMSVSYIYGKNRPEDSDSTGMAVEYAIKCLLEHGSVPVEFFPKLLEMPEVKKQLENRNDLEQISIPYKIKGYCKIGWQNIDNKYDNIRLALVNYNIPIVAWTKKGFVENHCILIYGIEYKNDMPYVKFQNSYGESYGTNGRSTMPLVDIEEMYILFDEKITLPFTDVPENAWFYKNILNMYSAGYVSGKSTTEFKPCDYLTRAELCAVLDRVLKRLDDNNISQFTTLENRLGKIEDKLNIL